MNKIQLIIKREYLSRVRKKSFLVTTFLVPLFMFGIITLVGYFAAQNNDKQRIAILDDCGFFNNQFDTIQKNYAIQYIKQPFTHIKQTYTEQGFDLLVHIDTLKNNLPAQVTIYGQNQVSLITNDYINNQLNSILQKKLMQQAGMNLKEIDSIQNIELKTINFTGKEEKQTDSGFASGIGYAMGFLIYIVMFIYGAGVMRGVMEEKTNRIVEVMVSSVKPFELMMGKIIGIGLVGLTQFLLWFVFLGIIKMVLFSFLPPAADVANVATQLNQMPVQNQNFVTELLQNPAIKSINFPLILFCFIFYFFGGYFLYASLFAAVGSMVNEDPQEAQQLTLPITLPIIIGFIIMATTVNNPHSKLAIFGSLFPLTSPIVMLGRIAYGVPTWQLITSMLLLIIGFVFFTWVSAKIYRIGILMYGKKASWTEIVKWLRNKNMQ